jgi:hypothetical protein
MSTAPNVTFLGVLDAANEGGIGLVSVTVIRGLKRQINGPNSSSSHEVVLFTVNVANVGGVVVSISCINYSIIYIT